MIDRYSELTDTLKVLEEKHEEANEEQIEQISLLNRQLEVVKESILSRFSYVSKPQQLCFRLLKNFLMHIKIRLSLN